MNVRLWTLSFACGLFVSCSDNDAGIIALSSSTTDDTSATDDTQASAALDSSSSVGGMAQGSASDGTGSHGDDLGPCGRAADCIEHKDDPITPFLSVYGPSGSCWQEFTSEQCWQDCRALFDGLGSSCADDPVCCECASVDDCSYSAEYDSCVEDECISASEISGCEHLDQCASWSPLLDQFRLDCLGVFTEACAESTEAYAACVFTNYDLPDEISCDDVGDCVITALGDFDCSATPACEEAARTMSEECFS